MQVSGSAPDDSVMISQPDLAHSVKEDSQQNNSVSSTINMMHNIQMSTT